MESNYMEKDRLLVCKLTEEMDEYCVQKLRGRVDYEIQRYMPKKIIFDFSSVSFMDSAGIGFLIGRYKFATMIGAEVELYNLQNSVKKIFEMSGVLKLISETDEIAS